MKELNCYDRFFTNNVEDSENIIMINAKTLKIEYIKIQKNNKCVHK